MKAPQKPSIGCRALCKCLARTRTYLPDDSAGFCDTVTFWCRCLVIRDSLDASAWDELLGDASTAVTDFSHDQPAPTEKRSSICGPRTPPGNRDLNTPSDRGGSIGVYSLVTTIGNIRGDFGTHILAAG